MFLSSSRDKFTPAGAHQDGHQHGVPIQISMYLGTVFLRICYEKLLAWPEPWKESLPYFFSHILDFIYWTVLIFILIYFDFFFNFQNCLIIVILDVECFEFTTKKISTALKRWKVFSIFDICVVHLVTGSEEDCYVSFPRISLLSEAKITFYRKIIGHKKHPRMKQRSMTYEICGSSLLNASKRGKLTQINMLSSVRLYVESKSKDRELQTWKANVLFYLLGLPRDWKRKIFFNWKLLLYTTHWTFQFTFSLNGVSGVYFWVFILINMAENISIFKSQDISSGFAEYEIGPPV